MPRSLQIYHLGAVDKQTTIQTIHLTHSSTWFFGDNFHDNMETDSVHEDVDKF